MILNYALIAVLVLGLLIFIGYLFRKTDSNAVLRVNKDGRTYTVEQMTKFIKHRLRLFVIWLRKAIAFL